ncbi:MAG TPA: hypothetical protein VJP07_04940 [Dehalococcoidia bacterium]|nr:hypothetical protein [Dehalococcoidia bacterium]
MKERDDTNLPHFYVVHNPIAVNDQLADPLIAELGHHPPQFGKRGKKVRKLAASIRAYAVEL